MLVDPPSHIDLLSRTSVPEVQAIPWRGIGQADQERGQQHCQHRILHGLRSGTETKICQDKAVVHIDR